MRPLLLVAALACAAPAVAQSAASLSGTWTVLRLTEPPDPDAEPAAGLDALIPDYSLTLAPTALSLSPDGSARVTLLAARADGYERAEVPASYRIDAGRLVLKVEGLDLSFALRFEDDDLVLISDDGATIRLGRT